MKPIEINQNCQFLKDLQDNSTDVNKGIYNLICSKRDLKLYVNGIKSNRHFKINKVKKYFGMNGNKQTLLNKLNLLYDVLNEGRK